MSSDKEDFVFFSLMACVFIIILLLSITSIVLMNGDEEKPQAIEVNSTPITEWQSVVTTCTKQARKLSSNGKRRVTFASTCLISAQSMIAGLTPTQNPPLTTNVVVDEQPVVTSSVTILDPVEIGKNADFQNRIVDLGAVVMTTNGESTFFRPDITERVHTLMIMVDGEEVANITASKTID